MWIGSKINIKYYLIAKYKNLILLKKLKPSYTNVCHNHYLQLEYTLEIL